MKKNEEILLENLDLLDTCLKYQTRGYVRYKEDLRSEIILQILEMDNEKLNKVLTDNALNAYISKIIFYSLKSKNSPFYKKFISPIRYSRDIVNYDFVDEES